MKLDDYLKKQKLTLTDFALSMKVNPSTLWHATRSGKKMSLKMAAKIVDSSGKKISYEDLVKQFIK